MPNMLQVVYIPNIGAVCAQHLTQVVYIPNIGGVYAQNVAGGVYPQHARKCYNTYKDKASQRLKG